MKVSIPEWSGNICTVFDFAHWLIIVEIDGIREIGREKIPF